MSNNATTVAFLVLHTAFAGHFEVWQSKVRDWLEKQG
jgi:hypothetical protein